MFYGIREDIKTQCSKWFDTSDYNMAPVFGKYSENVHNGLKGHKRGDLDNPISFYGAAVIRRTSTPGTESVTTINGEYIEALDKAYVMKIKGYLPVFGTIIGIKRIKEAKNEDRLTTTEKIKQYIRGLIEAIPLLGLLLIPVDKLADKFRELKASTIKTQTRSNTNLTWRVIKRHILKEEV